MKIASFRLRGIRCFEDTGVVSTGPGCNIFVGQNNSGKSTLLKAIVEWQIVDEWQGQDFRPYRDVSSVELSLTNIDSADIFSGKIGQNENVTLLRTLVGDANENAGNTSRFHKSSGPVFNNSWPNNFIVPFSAKRKAIAYDQSVNTTAQSNINGTFSNLYARIDRVATPGLSAHNLYREAIESNVGVLITTRSSPNGKEAGYYFDDENFVTLDRMGDGVSEIVALVVELSLAKKRVFVLEEPETNLHPRGLKALLKLIRESAVNNQFIISTHSNVVVRELSVNDTKIFRVYRNGETPSSPSGISEVENTASAHRELLRELGYEFGDFDLHEGWLFLEESSAETVIREVLIPWFAPTLKGRLRTFSAAGIANLEPSVAEFQRLITFIHLQPVYQDRLWVRADGDAPGQAMISEIQNKFSYLKAPRASTFSEEQFERFYPKRFEDLANVALSTMNKQKRREAKANLLKVVIEWSHNNEEEARSEWQRSAIEQIGLLEEIKATIIG